MMKSIAYTAVATLLAIPAALAGENMTFADIDTNSDGMLTLTEIQTAAPNVTATDMAQHDTNADGTLSEDEFNAWKDSKSEGSEMDKMEKTDPPSY